MQYKAVAERSRPEIETLLRSSDATEIADALLSAAYYEPHWKWVQGQCMTFSRREDKNVRWVSAVCFGHLARIHRQLGAVETIAATSPALQRPAPIRRVPFLLAGPCHPEA